jgi:hypothetical protein
VRLDLPCTEVMAKSALGLILVAGCGSSSGAPGRAQEFGSAGSAGSTITAAGASNAAGGGSAGAPLEAGGAAVAGAGAGGAQDVGGAPSVAGAGGATGSAGMGGASVGGSGNAGTAGAGVKDCAGLFCEDFESGALDLTRWNWQANGGQTVKVQSEQAAHGKYAVQFHGAPNVVSYDFIITKQAPAGLHGHHYGRAYFMVTPKPPQKHTEFLFAGSSGFPKLKYLELAESDLDWQLTFVQEVAPTGETYQGSSKAIPLAHWSCLTWEMNDSPDQISVSVDGAAQTSFDSITFGGKTTGLVGGFTDFGFGFYAWHPATYAFDLYFDDIVLDTKPIACLAQ